MIIKRSAISAGLTLPWLLLPCCAIGAAEVSADASTKFGISAPVQSSPANLSQESMLLAEKGLSGPHIRQSGGATSLLTFASQSSTGPNQLAEAYGKLPLSFEVNRGQADSSAMFLARGPGYRVFLTPSAVVVGLDGTPSGAKSRPRTRQDRQQIVLHTKFVGANSAPRITGSAKTSSKTNYFIGTDPSGYLTDIENFSRVEYHQLYPGIDLVFYGNPHQLEYDFIVAPGVDPGAIRLAISGAENIRLDTQGDLLLQTKLGELRKHRPVIYQEVDGVRLPINGGYVISDDGNIGFQVAAYDNSRPLVIDPVLSYSTYIGGKSSDSGMAIRVDMDGNAYLTGYTNSTNFPLQNPYDQSIGTSDTDIFVTKLNATGTALVYSTYLGGRNGADRPVSMAIDNSGNAYIAGITSGSDFPVTTTAYQKGAAGGGSVVAKLGPAGNTLSYSTYVLNTSARGVAVDSTGSAYLTGSATGSFLTTSGSFQSTFRSTTGTNAFVLKLNPGGTAAAYSTFLGGTGSDIGNSIAVDSKGDAYIGGSTTSTDFPLANPYQTTVRGAKDGFVTKLSPAGNSLVFSTYIGGTLNDSINALAIDQTGSVYITGETYSANFPVKNAFQPVKAGRLLVNSATGSAFVSKLLPLGDELGYSSFLGGEVCASSCSSIFNIPETPGDAAYGIAVDNAGHAFVTGLASSYTFPLFDSLQGRKQQENQDSLFVTKVSTAGSALLYSTFVRTGFSLSGTGPNGVPNGAGKSVAVDASGSAYVISESDSFNTFPTTTGAFRTSIAGPQNAVAFKLSTTPVTVTLTSSANPADSPAQITLTATLSNSGLAGNVVFYNGSGQLGTAAVMNGVATLTTTLAKGIHPLTAVFRGSSTAGDSPLLYQIVDNPLVCN